MRGKPAETREGKSAARTWLDPGVQISYLVPPQDNCDCLPRTVWLHRLQSEHQIAVSCGVSCGDAGVPIIQLCGKKTISPPESSIQQIHRADGRANLSEL